ncbi:MAG: hypothetical protein M0P74_00695 [Syntrophales bacterium]|jgi:hypothetical protein|nr:hypothetical protein [Syntrophales bacterium]
MVKDRKKTIAADDWDRASNAQRAWMICRAISEGKMDQEKIKRLLDVADQQDQIKLKVLHNAVVKCIKDYQTESTSARLNDWQKAEGALETFVVDLWEKHFQDEKTLSNILAVVDYLSGQGWKVHKSAVYNHKKEGRIRPQADGSFRISDVERYAETYLKRKDGSESGKLDKLQERKLTAEIAKTEAQTEHWVNRARASSGSYVPKEQHERDLARRAAVFRSDLETFARSEASEIVSLVVGDAGKIPELVTWLLGRFDGFLSAYAEEREFTVPLLPAEKETDVDPDDDEAEDNEES